MQTYGNVFGDREESGLVLFLPIYTHTYTLFPRRVVWLPSIIKRCVLCGACCLCKKSTSIRDHLSSFEAILIFSCFLTIAPGQIVVGGSHPSSHSLQRSFQEELHPKDRVAVCGTAQPSVTCQESCRAESSAPRCPGDRGSDHRGLSYSPVTHCVSCLQPGGSKRDRQPK